MDPDARLTAVLYLVKHNVPMRVAATLPDPALLTWFETMARINGELEDDEKPRPALEVIDFETARKPRL